MLEALRKPKMKLEPKRFRNLDDYLREGHRFEICFTRLELIFAGGQQQDPEPPVLVRGDRLPLAATLFAELNNYARKDSPGGVERDASQSAG
jgi:hypothetical protein